MFLRLPVLAPFWLRGMFAMPQFSYQLVWEGEEGGRVFTFDGPIFANIMECLLHAHNAREARGGERIEFETRIVEIWFGFDGERRPTLG